jgi:hypothetical protein
LPVEKVREEVSSRTNSQGEEELVPCWYWYQKELTRLVFRWCLGSGWAVSN